MPLWTQGLRSSSLHAGAWWQSSVAPSEAAARGIALRFWSEVNPEGNPDGLPNDYKLIRKEDYDSWIIFSLTFLVLIILDNTLFTLFHKKLTVWTALLYTAFYLVCAGAFCVYIYFERGPSDAFDWATGYLLEWMLSVDNLFVFHRIFTIFHTPDDQKHKPLFWGIVGAIVFRMAFFCIEQMLMHNIVWMHIVFGVFLVYTGYKAGFGDDEEDNYDRNPLFLKLRKHLRYVDRYEASDRGNPKFFTRVLVDKETGSEVIGSPPSSWPSSRVERKWHATRLLLVVICLEITDVIFAVDSVSAIVAQIPDLFLAYSACVFAMLGLRAMFFAVDALEKLFSSLKYGIALILIFLGIKLICQSWLHVPPALVCCILITTLFTSVVGPMVYERIMGVPEEPELQGPEADKERTPDPAA